MESELQALKHEVKSAWKVLGHVNTVRSVKGMDNVPVPSSQRHDSTASLATIIMITPTYVRWTQKADLTRLCQTLMHVRNLIWIVVEDSVNKTKLVTNFLVKCDVEYVHLNIRTPENLQLEVSDCKIHVHVCGLVVQQPAPPPLIFSGRGWLDAHTVYS